MRIRFVIATAVLVVVFGFAMPRIADYGEAWDAIVAMTAPELAVLAIAGLWNLFTYWPVLMLALPGLRLREAAVVNQASTAVANTVPAGSAVAVAVTFRILRGWGFTTESITNQTVLTGAWNQLVKLAMPVIALLIVAATGELQGRFVDLALWGVTVLCLFIGVSFVVLRIPRATERVGAALDLWVSYLFRAVGRPRTTAIQPWLVRLRAQMIGLLRHRAPALSAAAIVSHLSLYLMLLACIRVIGLSAEELSWSKVLVGFALVRLLSAIPVTPGGVGVVELGYVGFLATGDADGLESAVTAAVLVFRAITYALPVALGAPAWILYQGADSWRHPPNSRGTVWLDPGVLTP